MIIYVSATGNTRFVAERLSTLLDDEALDATPRIRAKDLSKIRLKGRPLIVCSPVHVSALPAFYAEYLRKVAFDGCGEAYGVLTDAGYAGIAGAELKGLLEVRGFRFRGYAELAFSGIHITSVTHRPIDEDECRRRIRRAAERLPEVAHTIREGESFENRHVFLSEIALTDLLSPTLRLVGMSTRGFWASERCVGCGRCERLCPVSAIRMRSGRPSWASGHCAHCMACIQNCPTEAIEYGDRTRGKRRYTLSRYLPVDL